MSGSKHRGAAQPETAPGSPVSDFLEHHYRHFNAATLVDAAREYGRQLEAGNHMMITLAGAMSTAELGLSLAEMIHQNKVHLISCTGANLEEHVFNLVAHKFGRGTGLITGWLADCVGGGQVTAIDFSPSMLANARAKGIAADFRQWNICHQPPPDAVLDLALCF